jgi:arylsulfatase A-like enzyme
VRIVYVDIDSLRPDHLGCYGYGRKTSPNIDALAREGVRLEHLYTSDAPCLPSRSTFFGGLFGIKTGLVNHGGTNADPRPEGPARQFRSESMARSFGERLRTAGWRVVSISSFPHRHSAYHVWHGFTETYDPGGDGDEQAHDVYAYAERWLSANHAADDWFLHLNFWDPHTPYDTPLSYGSPFAGDPPPEWLTQEIIDRQRASPSPGTRSALKTSWGDVAEFSWPRGAPEITDLATWKAWIDGYDSGIHYVDSFVGRLIDRLQSLGIADDTAIVVSADHGENQGELGVYGDHQTADEHTCRVPAIVRWPGVTDGAAGRSCAGLVYSVDLAATMLDLAGCPVRADWDGVSFAAGLRSGELEGRSYLVLQQGAWSCQRASRWDRYLLIRSYHTGFRDHPAVMLFDLEADPHEQVDLAAGRSDLVVHGLGLVDTWVDAQLGRAGASDPLRNVIVEGGPYHAALEKRHVCSLLRSRAREADAAALERDDGTPRDWVRAASSAGS